MDQFLTALRGPQQQQQVSVADTLNKLADRCQQSTQLADRRAAVLALRGLSRDYKQDVGAIALNPLLTVLEHDAPVDEEIAKAVLQTINTLCEVDLEIASKTDREAALAHTDTVLANPTYTQKLLALIQHDASYVRLGAIHLLNTLLSNRRAAVQAHFVNAPESSRIVIALLEEKRDVIRTEGLQLFQSLTTQNTDIQSIFAFGSSFETLLRIIAQEGGVEGGITVYSCLTAIDGLLRFNISTQNYFRELLPALPPLLLFPPTIAPDQETPQEFALQFWDAQKTRNVSVVVALIGMLKASEHIRLLTELGIASNAPTIIKTEALQLLSGFTQPPPLQQLVIPYAPVPETNGEEWDRLEPVKGIDLLVSTILDGEYGGVASTTGGLGKVDMELRTVALTIFGDYIKDETVAIELLSNMIPTSNNTSPTSAARLIPSALSILPSSPLSPATATRLQFACLIFSCLFRGPPNHSTTSPKAIARGLGSSPVSVPTGGGQFFVPADGGPPTSLPPEEAEDEPPSSLLQLLTEHLSLSMLARGRAGEDEGEARAWDRVIVGYLVLLCTWLWEDQKSVRVFLEGGGIGVLVEPISQTSGIDTLVQGLCALLFGICYHFNRESGGEITRQTLHSIIARLGADQLVVRMTRIRDDERFRHITPESIVLPPPLAATVGSQADSGGEIWLDWAFVEFWKSNHYTVRKGLSTDPDAALTNNADAAELQTIIGSLREMLRSQTEDVSNLKKQLAATKTTNPVAAEREAKLQVQVEQLNREREEEKEALQREISTLSTELSELREKKKEQEKEQEDLLVFLEEMSEKRKRDKAKMRTAGLEVSEDEAEADEDDDE